MEDGSVKAQVQMTKQESVKHLMDAIEVQKLQTELQELITRQVIARANEINAVIQVQRMTEVPEKPNEKEMKEFEKAKQATAEKAY